MHPDDSAMFKGLPLGATNLNPSLFVLLTCLPNMRSACRSTQCLVDQSGYLQMFVYNPSLNEHWPSVVASTFITRQPSSTRATT
jgi:hypothetical protein